jgi:hypothetical protein
LPLTIHEVMDGPRPQCWLNARLLLDFAEFACSGEAPGANLRSTLRPVGLLAWATHVLNT